jgi:site-specific DNA-cytosine methylase
MMEPTSLVQCALQMCPETKIVFAMAEEEDPAELGWVPVMVGGPECQPFSLAGKMTGHTRSSGQST